MANKQPPPPRLKIAETDDPDWLPVDRHGSPVFPVLSPRERTALVRACSAFGLKARAIVGASSGAPPALAHADTPDAVVGLGSETLRAARLYAHLTGRPFRVADDILELRRGRPAVVIAPSSRVDAHLMHYLTACAGQSATGLVFDATGEGRRQQVLVRAAVTFATTAAPTRIDVLTEHDFSTNEEKSWNILGARAPDQALMAALGAGACLLHFQSHSNGLDAFVSSTRSLCPLADADPRVETRRGPRCFLTGYCVRQDGSRTSLGDRLVSPNWLAARVLLFNTCSGLLDQTAVLHHDFTLGQLLARNERIGAAVMPWTVSAVSLEHVEGFLRSLSEGSTLGEAVARNNRNVDSSAMGFRLLLLGDPALTLRDLPTIADHEVSARQPRARSLVASHTANCGAHGTLHLFRDFLKRQDTGADAEVAASRRALDRLESDLRRNSATSCRSAARFRELLCELLAERGGRVYMAWLGEFGLPSESSCPHCERPGLRWSFRFENRGIPRRQLIQCPACGVVEDSPIGFKGRMAVRQGRIQLDFDVPAGRWTGRLGVWYVKVGDGLSMRWPRDVEGRPVTEVPVPATEPCVASISLWLLWDSQYVELSAPLAQGNRN